MLNNDWSQALSEWKMENGTTSEYAASLFSNFGDDETKQELLERLFMIGDYELEFLYSYTVHFLDLLEGMAARKDDSKLEINLDDIVGYTLEHMGINGLR